MENRDIKPKIVQLLCDGHTITIQFFHEKTHKLIVSGTVPPAYGTMYFEENIWIPRDDNLRDIYRRASWYIDYGCGGGSNNPADFNTVAQEIENIVNSGYYLGFDSHTATHLNEHVKIDGLLNEKDQYNALKERLTKMGYRF